MAAWNETELAQKDQQHLIHSLYHPGDHQQPLIFARGKKVEEEKRSVKKRAEYAKCAARAARPFRIPRRFQRKRRR
ncbi:hypothetical protein H0O03_03475 [Candidatus Micrarchaeota archaeon]|nr:hypothetical protein [Candidatus Micrarchaeota archaeon]